MARGLVAIAGSIALLALLSKGVGFGRELVIAAAYGAGAAKDAYTAAYVLPAFALVMLGGLTGPFHTVTQKVIATLRARGEGAAVPEVLLAILLLVSAIMGSLSLVSFFAAPWVIKAVASSLSPETFALAVAQLQIMSPMVLLGGLVGIFCGISNDRGDYRLPSLSPVLASVAVIAAIWWRPDPLSLAWGTMIGACGQFLLQAPAAFKALQGAKRPDFSHPELREFAHLLLPASIASSLGTLNVIIGTNFASTLPSGAISVYDYANKLIQLPLGILMTALLIPLFPLLTERVVAGDRPGMFHWLNRGLATIALATFPLLALFVVAGRDLVAVVYERGAFDAATSATTHQVMMLVGVGLFAYGARDLLIRAFYALGDSRTPLMVSLVGMGATVAFMASLIGPFGVLGLAAATALVTLFNAVLISFLLRRKLGALPLGHSLRVSTKALLAAALGGAFGHGAGLLIPEGSGFIWHVGRLAIVGGSLGLGYAMALSLLGLPVRSWGMAIARRLSRRRPA